MTNGLDLRARIDKRQAKWYGFIYKYGVYGYNFWYWSRHPLRFIITLLYSYPRRAITRFIQRGRRGYATEDLWSLDLYLAWWLPDAIRYYKTGHGWPSREEAATFDDWIGITEKMAQGFEAHDTLVRLGYDYKDPKARASLMETREEGLALFVKWFGDLWD